MDIKNKVNKMSKARVLYELDRLSRLTKITSENNELIQDKKIIKEKTPDYNIFEKPKDEDD